MMWNDQQPGDEPVDEGDQPPMDTGNQQPVDTGTTDAGTTDSWDTGTTDAGTTDSWNSGTTDAGTTDGGDTGTGAPQGAGSSADNWVASAEDLAWQDDPQIGMADAEYTESLENMPQAAEGLGAGGEVSASTGGGGAAAATAACLAAVTVPLSWSTPARDLTRREARDIVVYLIGQGAFTLRQAWTPLQFDAACNVTSPRPDTRVALDPPVIDGVRFTSKLHPQNNTLFNLDVRMLVLLYRLARMLRETWGVTEIFHLGIGAGNGASNDCHNSGRAMDFAGVAGTISGSSTPSLDGPYQIDVYDDWGQQPVTMPDGTTRANWPAIFTQTYYRLSQSGPNFLAYAIFQDVYNFATLHASDTSPQRNGNGAATAIGVTSRFIIHPDYPSGAALRPAHQNHIHMQIGPTGEETNPP